MLVQNPINDGIDVNCFVNVQKPQVGQRESVPVKWFPGLARAKTKQRKQYIILPRGHGIHWPQLDEDLSLFGFLFPGGLLSFREMKRSS